MECYQIYTITVLLFLPILAANPPNCTQYGVCTQFVPAPPGQIPNCAIHEGSTYCEQLDYYPRQLIMYLIQKWGYDFNTLLNNESTDEFVYRRQQEFYGPPSYRPPPPPQYYYNRGSPPIIQPSISYGPLSFNTSHTSHVSYPDRTYKIDPHLLTNALQQPPGYYSEGHFINNQQPEQGFLYSPPPPSLHQSQHRSVQWYKRSKDSQTRKKRQNTPDGVTQLCPTSTNFIMPKAALNTRGSWMYTVNLKEIDDKYTQLVRSETCVVTVYAVSLTVTRHVANRNTFKNV
ncbi:conserved hypothetical protein [Pediculus humanus corporis]|uniref:Spaetzle domain-containing protein n=1 Tax=Pediculus humanus subsp. corporis TaxID=121224 RepID=E0W380_PEDHC|nr:uncharacterized protein Phum_PHUM601860 [Pediculus humanus corporis]EEB20086.1 conserved hypothetical protein [Pediculus humanus corporis]